MFRAPRCRSPLSAMLERHKPIVLRNLVPPQGRDQLPCNRFRVDARKRTPRSLIIKNLNEYHSAWLPSHASFAARVTLSGNPFVTPQHGSRAMLLLQHGTSPNATANERSQHGSRAMLLLQPVQRPRRYQAGELSMAPEPCFFCSDKRGVIKLRRVGLSMAPEPCFFCSGGDDVNKRFIFYLSMAPEPCFFCRMRSSLR